jgi:LysM repeat protein
MNRKDTILVAVLINAGVLVVLFTSALKNKQQEKSFIQEPTAHVLIEPKLEPVSIMKDEIDLAIEEAKLVQQTPASLVIEAAQSPLMEQALEPVVLDVQPQSAPQAFIDVTVKKGDFLAKIAKRHGISVEEIMKINGLKNTNLRIGQVLKVPSAQKPIQTITHSPKVTQDTATKYYVIKAGDNPWTIAQKHKMKLEELLKMNHLTAEKAKLLKVGDKLKVKE